MRSIYFRLVVVVLIVVWSSVALSSLTTSRSFRSNLSDRMTERLNATLTHAVSVLEAGDPSKVRGMLPSLANLAPMNQFVLYDAAGSPVAATPDNGKHRFPEEAVRKVLADGRWTDYIEPEEGAPRLPYAGMAFTAGDRQYALFISPNAPRQIRDFESIRNPILWNVLIIGSLLLLVASRYLVRPVHKITEATQRIAKGDFNVKLDIRQKDELGTLAKSINEMAEDLKKMEAMRQEFVSNVSHDIQTPLTSIRGFSKLLQQPHLPDDERLSYLKIIEQESERLSRLSENLLKLASLESDNYPYHPAPLKLDEQLRRVVVACEPLWSAKQLDVRLELPRLVVMGDEDSLNQVWTNLLHNSIKFTPERGSIRIELLRDTEHAIVRLSDTGIGISEEDKARIFQRFFKADSSRSEHGGSGLGLAIVKKIIDLHQGSIDIAGEKGRGTVVTVKLPFRL